MEYMLEPHPNVLGVDAVEVTREPMLLNMGNK